MAKMPLEPMSNCWPSQIIAPILPTAGVAKSATESRLLATAKAAARRFLRNWVSYKVIKF